MLLRLRGKCLDTWNSVKQIWFKADSFAGAHETALIWAFGILLKFAYDAMYIWAASPQYAYAGLVYSPSLIKYCISIIFYFLIFMVLPKREKNAIGFLLHLQFVFTVAPMLSFYAFSNGSTKYMLMVVFCVLLQALIVNRKPNGSNAIRIVGVKHYLTVMLGILVVFAAIIPILYNGFEGLKAFDFDYIYTMRANATYPPGFGYLWSWITRVIIPFAVLRVLEKKEYLKAALLAVLQIFFYMESGQKFELFILFPVVAIYLLSKSGHLLKLLYLGFIALCLGVIIAYQLDKISSGLGIYINALVGIRAIFHPADNKFNFYECFSQLPKTYFSDGMIGSMLGLTYPYAGSLGQVVHAFLGGEFLSANMNTGYLGESFAQMGFLGMIVMSILLAYILRGLQSFCHKNAFASVTALFSVFIIILNDGALFTTLFTGGMFIAFLLVMIYYGNDTEESLNGIQRT